eukprot:TRINITY_DN7414_c0_g1_i7.p1 TRINITY_DN7414_c0_g1~~TRINITY_DN7414_c0_g1_i7.p1  ORF type:complete len:236 (-),score=35.17 TRINITY_DN7414_c0_g1_i7:134-841(-)
MCIRDSTRSDELGVEDVPSDVLAPSTIDWSRTNCDHGVKNQGPCGSCWAFAMVGMLSYRCCVATGDKGWLSTQELLSCDKEDSGCQGGGIDTPIEYIKANKGLVTEKCFPYQASNIPCPGKCKDGSDWKRAHVCNCVEFKRCHGTDGMKKCLASGPTTFGFDVQQSFMHYKGGIYKCDDSRALGGHAVLAMGVSEKPECHFVVKNSWGGHWGKKGYFKFACGTCQMDGGVTCVKF